MQIKENVGILIKKIHDELTKNIDNELRDKDLTSSQMNVLVLLNEVPTKKLSLKEIEKALHVAQPTAAGIVTRLEQKRFIESFGDTADKRIKMIKITEHGEKICKESKKNMINIEDMLLESLDNQERKELYRLLSKVKNNLK